MLSFLSWGSKLKSDEEQPSPPQSAPAPPSELQSSRTQTQKQQPPGIPMSLKLLVGGMTFFTLSLLITRRSLNRKRLASIPPYYTGSMYHKPNVNGAMEAFEALNLATINVASFGMMFTGGLLYKFDIHGLEDMRRIVRGGLNGGGGGNRSDEELEEDLEEWIISIMGKRAQKDILDRKAELERERESRKKGDVENKER